MTRLRTRWIGIAVLVAALGTFSSSVHAYTPTAEQKSACMSDALRLCSAQIPNVDRIIMCLARNKKQLGNQTCRSYFDRAKL